MIPMSTQEPHNLCTVLKMMDHGTHYKLVLIVAPEGAGKAKLLQQWVQNWPESSPSPPVWLIIDAEDNQPNQFLSKLISELIIWDPHIEDCVDIQVAHDRLLSGTGLSELRSTPDLHQKIEPLLDAIINKLVLIEGDRFLIMHNYDIIEDLAIHRIVAYIIDFLPPNFHLIISSQVSPPLQIPRLRARRELLEIGL